MKYLNWFATAVGYTVIVFTICVDGPMVYKLVYDRAFPVVPKFAVGDCIKSFDSFDHKIIEIFPARGFQKAAYGYTVGADCRGPDYYNHCSTSIGDVDLTDINAVKIDCPK